MKIETEFSIGDKVWLLRNNKATEMEIRSISLIKTTMPTSAIHISYCGEDKNGKIVTVREGDCFFSKSALVDCITTE